MKQLSYIDKDGKKQILNPIIIHSDNPILEEGTPGQVLTKTETGVEFQDTVSIKEEDFEVKEMRIIETEDDPTQVLSKEQADSLYQAKGNYAESFNVGNGLELTEDRVLNVTLDTKVFKVVQSLPDKPEEGDENKIHLVSQNNGTTISTTTKDLYFEYLYVDNTWELLGQSRVEVDLSNYYTKDELKELVELANEWKALKAEMKANPTLVVAFNDGELIPITDLDNVILTSPVSSAATLENKFGDKIMDIEEGISSMLPIKPSKDEE